LLERRLNVRLRTRGADVSIFGESERVSLAQRVIEQLLDLVRRGAPVALQDVDHAVRLLEADREGELAELAREPVLTTHDRRGLIPKSRNQAAYVKATQENDLVFGIGPAGTGKTYLAMAAAVAALQRHEVKRIVLARPAVEAGEKLGFLPGSIVEKVDPYLRPLYDALYDMMPMEKAARLVENGILEVAPLAFMRGRTLNQAFVILDEAQNTTPDQMKMFLTRLGYSSRAVVTGDITQVDLPPERESGLEHGARILAGIDGIAVIRFRPIDVVRHPLVQAIVRVYDAEADAEQP